MSANHTRFAMRRRVAMLAVLMSCLSASGVFADADAEIARLLSTVRTAQDLTTKIKAIEELKGLGVLAVPAMRELLTYDNPVVKIHALSALGNLSPSPSENKNHRAWRAVPEMIRLLDDPDIRVRRAALYGRRATEVAVDRAARPSKRERSRCSR